MKNVRFYALLAMLVACTATPPTGSVRASSFQQVSLSQEVQGAALIFEGRVIRKQVRMSANGEPFTYFTFEVLDVIKGTYAAPTIELGFMGGPNMEGLTLYVSDMRMPEVGERGIYFVESLSRQQVHPLYGWQQGHYLVVPNPSTSALQVVPVSASPDAMLAAPGLDQFKSQLRSMQSGE